MAGLYLHIPFCSFKCLYCDFYSGNQLYLIDDYVKSLICELKIRSNYLGMDSVGSIYFGGGTPSLLSINHLKSILDFIFLHFKVDDDCEITLECNPENINNEYVDELYALGFNRISLGIQFLDDEILKKFNRNHNKDQIIKALHILNSSKFDNLSIDLIYAVPGISDEFLLSSLEQLIVFDIQHISAYSLTIARNSQLFWKINKGEFMELNESEFLSQYEIVRKFLVLQGFIHYEISNYAKAGFYSKHNQGYWEQIPYLGIGVSAHSYNMVSRQWNGTNIKKYIREFSLGNGIFDIEYEELTNIQKYNEYIILKLRTFNGLSVNYIHENFGHEISGHFLKNVHSLQGRGYFFENDGVFFPNESDLLIADFLSGFLMI